MTTRPTFRKTGKSIIYWKPVLKLIQLSKRIVLPGFDGMPLYDVTRFFINGLAKGYITSRASAISFSFFLAAFPFFIFLFTIIPFIPIQNFQHEMLNLIREFIPSMAWEAVHETIVDVITHPRGSLLILNFILALFFSTNGINSLIEAFNNTAQAFETRTILKQYMISVVILLILSVLLIVAIGLMAFGPRLLAYLFPDSLEKSYFFLIAIDGINSRIRFSISC